MSIRLYNTLTRKREIFKPLKDKEVKMFVCGLTVYDYLHLGHARTYSFYDTLARLLRYAGYKVTYLQNVTDIGHLLDSGEDRMIKKAREEKKHPLQIADFYYKHELEMFEKLRIQRPDLMPRATEHTEEIIEQVKTILRNGYAYVVDGSVYYDVSKFEDYGKLSRRKTEELIPGARVDVREEKQSPADFALWIKAPPEHIMKWPSPWSQGYPGWHIEDTAIAMKYFGPQYDIHGGAIELAFPHHEAEIAQAEATTGIKPYVKYWVHAGLLTINGQRMGRSMGNMVTVMDALTKHTAETLRMWIASTHYRKPLDYNEKDLDVAKAKVDRIISTLQRIEGNIEKAKTGEAKFSRQIVILERQFLKALKDDVNTPLALTRLFEIITLTNKQIDKREFSKADLEKAEKTIQKLGEFFQIIPEVKEEKASSEVSDLVEKREEARRRKNWTQADAIRDQVRKLGYIVEDTAEGSRVRRVKG
ncbi:MAG TPA: cysteine--tRNA ligase [Candidatus Bathyarchaeia archaeon]|nr:cysteine--tRNA ligase [Candidatus Bathyarchaeia archaeon]